LLTAEAHETSAGTRQITAATATIRRTRWVPVGGVGSICQRRGSGSCGSEYV
jgi:hypothetical protein